jgi:hypothetical protein
MTPLTISPPPNSRHSIPMLHVSRRLLTSAEVAVTARRDWPFCVIAAVTPTTPTTATVTAALETKEAGC